MRFLNKREWGRPAAIVPHPWRLDRRQKRRLQGRIDTTASAFPEILDQQHLDGLDRGGATAATTVFLISWRRVTPILPLRTSGLPMDVPEPAD
jgi:hypothetical protein